MCTCYSVYAVYVYRAAHVYTWVAYVNLNNKHNDDGDCNVDFNAVWSRCGR